MLPSLWRLIALAILAMVALTSVAYASQAPIPAYSHPRMPTNLSLPTHAGIPLFHSMKELNHYINKNYRYIAEKPESDHWKTPKEFFTDKGGDCEDFAIVKLAIAKQQHLARSAAVALVTQEDGQIHAILIADNLIYDNQDPAEHSYTILGKVLL